MAFMSTEPAPTDSNDAHPAHQPRERTREDFTVVEVRRGVRIQSWIVLGIILGLALSFVFAYFLPENPDFSRAQVFGFLGVFLTALSVVILTGVGLIVNAFVTRRSTPQRVLLERVPEDDEQDAEEVEQDAQDAAEAAEHIGQEAPRDSGASDAAAGPDAEAQR